MFIKETEKNYKHLKNGEGWRSEWNFENSIFLVPIVYVIVYQHVNAMFVKILIFYWKYDKKVNEKKVLNHVISLTLGYKKRM